MINHNHMISDIHSIEHEPLNNHIGINHNH